jgi:hypothetical protein
MRTGVRHDVVLDDHHVLHITNIAMSSFQTHDVRKVFVKTSLSFDSEYRIARLDFTNNIVAVNLKFAKDDKLSIIVTADEDCKDTPAQVHLTGFLDTTEEAERFFSHGRSGCTRCGHSCT